MIRRFIDPDAEFIFVDDIEAVPAEATPFDMRGADLSHHGGDCTFEAFLERYDLDDRSLRDIAQIVHEADLGDERYDAPEAAGCPNRNIAPEGVNAPEFTMACVPALRGAVFLITS